MYIDDLFVTVGGRSVRPAWPIHVLQGSPDNGGEGAHHRHRGLLLREDMAGLGAGVYR